MKVRRWKESVLTGAAAGVPAGAGVADAAETDGGGGGEEAAAAGAATADEAADMKFHAWRGELSGNCKQPRRGGGGGRLLSCECPYPTYVQRLRLRPGADFSGKRARVSQGGRSRCAARFGEREGGGGGGRGGERGGPRGSVTVREAPFVCGLESFATVNAL